MNPYIKIPLSSIIPTDRFVVKSQREIREYAEGNIGSRKVIGQKYELVDVSTFETFMVKVPEIAPTIPQAMIEKAKQPLLVTLKEAKFSFYVNQGRLAMSFSAEKITLSDDDQIDLMG